MENVLIIELGKKHRIILPYAGVSLVLKRFNKRKVGWVGENYRKKANLAAITCGLHFNYSKC